MSKRVYRTVAAMCVALSGVAWGAGGASAGGAAPSGETVALSGTGKGPYLFSYFYGNGDGLHLAASEDGLSFVPLNGDKIYLKPTVGSKLMRDPCLREGPDGVYHLVWTTGWHDKGFGVASSKDLIHWSGERFVTVWKQEPKANNTWAPELFYDDQKGEWMIFWATTIPGKYPETDASEAKNADMDRATHVVLNHRLYYVTTKDFAHFSETKLLYDPGYNCIDATITKVASDAGSPFAGKYVMVFKDERKVPVEKYLKVAVAEHPEGPWGTDGGKAGEPFSIQWVEGPTICKVGEGWNVYYDQYRQKKYGAVRTTDWVHFKTISNEVHLPRGARHGTVIEVSRQALARLKGAGAVEAK